ncbi:MAG: DMT family transporter [Roseivivax sp.]|nr:DMT family transporter [Roseivivax sp.]
MALGFFVFAAADAAAKVLTQSLHPLEILWFRQSGLFTAIVIYILMRGTAVLRTRSPKLQIARGVTATFSAVFFLIGITYVPLADATSVTFIAPFMVTVLAALILRESVGIRRWTAVGVGLVGVLIVIRPGMGVFHPAIVFVLMAATAFSLRQVLSRMLSGQENIMTTVAYTSIVSFVLACIGLPFVFTMPDTPQQWLAIGIVAVLAATGEYLVIRALDIAQAVVVAPLHYTIILWSTGYGFVLFGDLPDGWTLLGCAIIVASGLYTLNRERLAARRKARD